MVQTISFAALANTSVVTVCPAKALVAEQRQELAVQALAGTFTITALAEHAEVSRKFVYQQISIAQSALEQAFTTPPTADAQVLFSIPVTKPWLRQTVLALLLLCHSSYRGVIDFFHDCFDVPISLGTIHNIVRDAIPTARTHNDHQPLGHIRFGLLDEIFQTGLPILVGVDALSTYCFLLRQEENRDAVTWGVRLLELYDRDCDPDAFVADFGSGLRAGLDLALPLTPCRGDIFHALQTVLPVVTALDHQAYEAIAARDDLERQAAKHQRRHGRADKGIVRKLANAKAHEVQAIALADDVALLARWLREDILALAGPCHTQRLALYDFVVAQLRARAPRCVHRLDPLCKFLNKHRNELLAFAVPLDQDLTALAADFQVSVATLRDFLRLCTLSVNNPRHWPLEADLRQRLRDRFHVLSEAMRAVAARTIRASSAVENLNSRLRNYFTLRRHLGPDYLTLLQFFLNHHRFQRSECPERIGKSPAELLTGQAHPHWLEMLGYERFSRN